jgi:NadR type nicotinamide-nucleotide adenylyltransferase
MLRVVLSGVESTGKSTLAERLAQRFGGIVVPEFGRTYTEVSVRPLTLPDHHAIAEGHASHAQEAAAADPPLLVEDTDIVMTTAWATMLFGVRDPKLAARPSLAHLHLLLMPDVPFVPDPVRMFGEEAQRLRFHVIVESELQARKLAYTKISGDFPAREAAAVAAIEARL